MSRARVIISFVAGAMLVVPPVLAGQSVPISAACRPLIDAERKTILTPHHAMGLAGLARADAKEVKSELISINGGTYLLIDGKWRRSGITTKEELDQMNSNLASAKVFSCQHTGDGVSGGVPAEVYTAHTENEGVKNDARIWVGKANGLVLRTDTDLDEGDGPRHHVSLAYDYVNVHAPAGVP